MEWLIILQYAVTALLSAANAAYFLIYRTSSKRRRWGALALAMISLAGAAQSLFFALLYVRLDGRAVSWARWLLAGALPLLAALLISAMILRQSIRKRQK